MRWFAPFPSHPQIKTREAIRIANVVIYGPDGRPISSGTGYGEAGASFKKRALKGFNAISGSAFQDIDQHNSTLRQRARMLYMASPIATSAIRTNRTNVIGCGLRLKSRINRDVLNLSTDEATEAEKRMEMEFDIWAKNKRSCDATGVNDFYALQQLAFISWLLSGDAFVLFKHGPTDLMNPYSLRLHIIEADRICTPPPTNTRAWGAVRVDGRPINNFFAPTEGRTAEGNLIHDGVEVDKTGAITAYHICTEYPASAFTIGQDPKWVRVQAYGDQTGMPNILQIMDAERPDQYRGVPYLAQIIEPLLQSRRYTESELMAALVESFFTAFVKIEAKSNGMPFNEAGDSISSDPNDYEMGPGIVNVMKPGEDVIFADPKRPTSGFDAFMAAISKQVGAAVEVPSDLLMKDFNASYSASRAALLEAWKAFKMRREWFVSDFCNPVYAAWMAEAVARGRINAPGFFEDPLVRAAWLGSEWIGPSQGQLDPVKEITAEIMAIAEGITTREQSTVKLNGGSWDANVEQIARENQMLFESAGAPQQLLDQQLQTGSTETLVIENLMRNVLKEAIMSATATEPKA